jgi:hypothetical protein
MELSWDLEHDSIARWDISHRVTVQPVVRAPCVLWSSFSHLQVTVEQLTDSRVGA